MLDFMYRQEVVFDAVKISESVLSPIKQELKSFSDNEQALSERIKLL